MKNQISTGRYAVSASGADILSKNKSLTGSPQHHVPAQTNGPVTEILLFMVSVALLVSVQNFLGKSVFEKVRAYKQEFKSGVGKMSVDSLMGQRFGLDYLLPQYLSATIKDRKPVLLLPPAAYVKKFITQQPANSLMNPLYLYYMNNAISAVTVSGKNREQANCTIMIDKNGRCYPIMINNRADLALVIRHFNKGEPFSPGKE